MPSRDACSTSGGQLDVLSPASGGTVLFAMLLLRLATLPTNDWPFGGCERHPHNGTINV
jgi:hypothetical protein